MKIVIPAVEIGDVICTEGDVSISLSNSVAVRIVPVDSENNYYPDNVITVVGGRNQADINELIDSVLAAVEKIVEQRSYGG